MKTSLLLLSLILASFCVHSQEGANYQPKHTYNIELGLPVATSNAPFKRIMQGLVSANTHYQYHFPFNVNVGLGIKYSYFTVNEFSISQPVFGGIHSGGAYGKVGWDKFYSDIFSVDFGVKIGYAQHYVTTEVQIPNEPIVQNRVEFSNVFVEPTLGLIAKADRRNSYRFNIGYTFYGFPFQPVDIGLESNGDYQPDVLNNSSQFFYIGFGYTLYIGEKPEE